MQITCKLDCGRMFSHASKWSKGCFPVDHPSCTDLLSDAAGAKGSRHRCHGHRQANFNAAVGGRRCHQNCKRAIQCRCGFCFQPLLRWRHLLRPMIQFIGLFSFFFLSLLFFSFLFFSFCLSCFLGRFHRLDAF